jgi:hypothetical protein
MVIGYHTGKYNAELDAYLVSEAEAHSWPEIYFPGYGWVEFEPTAGRPALIRGEGLPYAPALDAEIPAELRETAPSFDLLGMLKSGSNYLLGGLIVAITAGAIWTLVKAIRASRLPPSAVISVIFADLRGQAVALGMSDGVGMTPSELSVSFRDRLAALARRSQGTRLLGPAQQEIEQIVNAYIGASYTRHHFTERERIETRAVWRRLKWRLRWARAIQHFRSSAD